MVYDCCDDGAMQEATTSKESRLHLPTDGDFKFIVSLQKANSKSVGFLTYTALCEYFDRRQVWVSRENGDPCGYLLFGSNRCVRPVRDPGVMKIVQACIQYDARRVKHATELVQRLERKAVCEGYERISLWCAEDLEANVFWELMGFNCIGTRIGGVSRGTSRMHNRWVKVLPRPFQMQLFT